MANLKSHYDVANSKPAMIRHYLQNPTTMWLTQSPTTMWLIQNPTTMWLIQCPITMWQIQNPLRCGTIYKARYDVALFTKPIAT